MRFDDMTEKELRALLPGAPLVCVECGQPFLARRDARTCSPSCRVAQHRGKGVPAFLTARPRWVRFDKSKRPLHALTGQLVDVTASESWVDFETATESPHGVGVGFVLTGDGVGCYDLDDKPDSPVFDSDGRATARTVELVESIVEKIRFVEISPSGSGLHVWVNAPKAKGQKRDGVERYTTGRYMTVTGNRVSVAGLVAGALIVGEIEKTWTLEKAFKKTSRRGGSSQKKT